MALTPAAEDHPARGELVVGMRKRERLVRTGCTGHSGEPSNERTKGWFAGRVEGLSNHLRGLAAHVVCGLSAEIAGRGSGAAL